MGRYVLYEIRYRFQTSANLPWGRQKIGVFILLHLTLQIHHMAVGLWLLQIPQESTKSGSVCVLARKGTKNTTSLLLDFILPVTQELKSSLLLTCFSIVVWIILSARPQFIICGQNSKDSLAHFTLEVFQ